MDTLVANAYFLPASLEISGDIKPKQLHRGIYQAVVYSGKLELTGGFARPDFFKLRIKPDDVLWDEALVAFAIPDLRGVKETLNLNWGGKAYPLLPGSRLRGFQSGMFANVGGLRENESAIPFRLELPLNGSVGLNFAPVGAQTSAKLTSTWPDPSFRGAFLPTERTITAKGFEATWQVSYYGRDYGQQWTDRDAAAGLTPMPLRPRFLA